MWRGAEDEDGEKTKSQGLKAETAATAGIWLSKLKPYCLVILLTSRSYNTLQVTTLSVTHHSVTSLTNLCLLATGKPDLEEKKINSKSLRIYVSTAGSLELEEVGRGDRKSTRG